MVLGKKKQNMRTRSARAIIYYLCPVSELAYVDETNILGLPPPFFCRLRRSCADTFSLANDAIQGTKGSAGTRLI